MTLTCCTGSFETGPCRRELRKLTFCTQRHFLQNVKKKKNLTNKNTYQLRAFPLLECLFLHTLDFTQGILERLDAGEIVIGDGGFVFALEKRGYVKAGPWTPEAAAEHPEAGTTFLLLHLKIRVLCQNMFKILLCFSASAAPRVSEGWLQCHADVHFLRE